MPACGVPSERPAIEELKLNHDFAVPKDFDHEKVIKDIAGEQPVVAPVKMEEEPTRPGLSRRLLNWRR